VLKLFTAPKSYTIDLSRFCSNSAETRTIGAVCVVIHEARHLLKADINGSSDPYVLVSFAHVGKSLYATKVKKDSLNPIFEELAIVKITQEELDEEDK
jgi:Ca2+-dependent lipid-binding protein